MALQSPIDLATGNWYYFEYSEFVFKVLQNNISIIDGVASGYILVEPVNAPPKKFTAAVLQEKLADRTLKEVKQDNTPRTPNPRAQNHIRGKYPTTD